MIYNYNVPSELVEQLGFCKDIEFGPDTYMEGHFRPGVTNRLFHYDENDTKIFQALVLADTVCAHNPEAEEAGVDIEQIGDVSVCLITVYAGEAIYFLKESDDFTGLLIVTQDQGITKSAESIDGRQGDLYDAARNAFELDFDRKTRRYTLTPTEKSKINTSPFELPERVLED